MNPTTPTNSTTTERRILKQPDDMPYHIYHAEANVLSGKLQRPIQQEIERQIPLHLQDRRGGHFTRVTEDFSLEGFFSFKRGETRVSGSLGVKTPGWVTLSTSILGSLNAFEVITADRVVSQISTRHSYENGSENAHVPAVTFLGTQFKNLALNGIAVQPILDLGICSKRPSGRKKPNDEPRANMADLPYVTDLAFLTAALEQVETILKCKSLPIAVRNEYESRKAAIGALSLPSRVGEICTEATRVTCSLVERIQIKDIHDTKIPGLVTVGNLLIIPDFGTVALAEIEVGVELSDDPESRRSTDTRRSQLSSYFRTTMLKMQLGCIGHGTVSAGSTKSNGLTRP
jgi:hypothetical protein